MAEHRENREHKLALVVDDSVMQCNVLSILLKEEGYHVYSANDGARGVDMYVKYQPDLVLMDINMPVMNGYEATRRIKHLSKGTLAPLIFITSLDSEQAYIESIEAGGDGILVRPFSPEVFKAKIKSIQRISDLYAQVKALQQTQQKDAELAEQLMSGVIESRNFGLERIGLIKKAATLFSGDIQLISQCPNGDINILLGDFTGHGLRSSIGAIPLSETFRVMTKKGFTLFEIVTQINSQLYKLLPTDLFLAASFVHLSSQDETAYMFNAGLPDNYIFQSDGTIKQKILSMHPPLGVLKELLPNSRLEIFSIQQDDHIVLISDGIIEARDEKGEMYGEARFEQMASKGVIQGKVAELVIDDVNLFCSDMMQEDDMSLIDIPCGYWQNELFASGNNSNVEDRIIPHGDLSHELPAWEWRLKLTGERLAKINPIPMAMTQIQEIEGSGEHWQSLYTILTELFVNALDHGVLNLNSDIKTSAEGFAQYFKEREEKLNSLTEGFIEISFFYYPHEENEHVSIQIKDSGEGFSYAEYLKQPQHMIDAHLSGRGISLVSKLCDSLVYSDKGTIVEAKYVWT